MSQISVPLTPRDADGKALVTSNAFPNRFVVNMAGAADDLSPTPPASGVGEGTKFKLQKDSEGEATLEWFFSDVVYLSSGLANFKDAVFGDWASFEVYAPATPVTANGSNEGNCNLYDIGGGAHLITPAAGNGAYDVDLDDAAYPVPAPDGDGYWLNSYDDTGSGTVSAGTPGSSAFNLFDFAITLNRFAAYTHLLGTGLVRYGVENSMAKAVNPRWKFKTILHNEGGSHTVQMVWHLILARKRTV